MAYGGKVYATVDVDIVQTDVDAIVQGLGGMGGSTLGDLWTLLSEISGNLYYWDDPTYGTKVSWLEDIDAILGNMSPALWSSGEFRSVADLLDDVRGQLNADGDSAAWWLRDCAYSSSATASLLSGSYYGPITDIAGNTYELREYLSGYYYGPLTDIRDYMSGYSYGVLTDISGSTWDIREHLSGYNGGPLTSMDYSLYEIQSYLWNSYYGASAADLLGEIRDQLSAIRGQTDLMTFGTGGRLLVETQ
ncbi:MAG: hypothetical protein BWX88_04611 [Planctomycetes bacterium ADurb.Bin126]|nr:MAG: hypothetical protein BWX88_04611 [Planctomycetes bacterium ADurb.Bin126]